MAGSTYGNRFKIMTDVFIELVKKHIAEGKRIVIVGNKNDFL